ncbi:MAG: cation diffusion facilitator family transporter [Gemmatimonadaceae bacterium]
MAHDHEHGHSHGVGGHSHAPASFGKAFAIGIVLNAGYVVAEVVYGRLSHSVALVADAGHNLGDVLGLLFAWGASILVTQPPSGKHTYGFRASSILAALVNAVVLLVTIGGIAWEAIRRLQHPANVDGGIIIWIAAVGILVNGITALLFLSGRKGDLNIRGAFVHMAGDTGIAAGVVLAGIAILLTGLRWIDPVVSLVIVVVILHSTWGLLRDSVNLALDAVPEGIALDAVHSYLETLPDVTEVHDLHIWAMSTTETALTAHLVIPEIADHDGLLARCCEELHDKFGIEHATLQLECGNEAHPCARAVVGAV